MKWVAITLLLLNAVFLVVHLSQDEQTDKAAEKAPDLFPFSGPRLALLAEKEKLDKIKQFAEKNRQQQLAAAESARKKAQQAAAPAESRLASKPKPAPQPKSTALACYSVGPLLLSSDVKSVSQLFRQADIPVQERPEIIRKQVGYWVYVPPLPSAQQARDALSKIKEVDAQIITEGTKANAISVGVYKTEALGAEQRKILAKLGFKARLEPLFRTQPQYWLDLELMTETQMPDTLWGEISAGYPRIKQLRRKCD